jgi:hypothetical protein
MSPEQLLRDLFWSPSSMASLPVFVLSLGLAAGLGVLLGVAYIRFGRSVSNRRQFAHNFLLVTVTTTLIITIVKSSLALSLGLVGALSIVRFRAAIKEPEELAFLFLAISVGLGLGAGQALLTLVALVVILGLIGIRHAFHREPDQPNLFVTVSGPGAAGLTAGSVMRTLADVGADAQLKRVDNAQDAFEACFAVDFGRIGRLEAFTEELRIVCPAVRVSCVDDRGLAS